MIIAKNLAGADIGWPKRFGRSPTLAFPGAVKAFTLSVGSRPICARHLIRLSMSTQVTVRGKDWQERNDEAQSLLPVRSKC
jgi:hypothetical protein